MYSRQLMELEEYIIKELQNSSEYIRLDYILFKKKRLKSLREGDCIYLGDSMPKLYIVKNTQPYGEVHIYSSSNKLLLEIEPILSYSDIDIKKSKVLIEPRVALIRLDNTIELSIDIFKDIYLYIGNKIFAKASLKIGDSAYILKIKELFNE